MIFILGVITGIALSILIFAILVLFRVNVEKNVGVFQRALSSISPRSRGAIFLPEDEADIARNAHIEENKAKGLDTRIEELL